MMDNVNQPKIVSARIRLWLRSVTSPDLAQPWSQSRGLILLAGLLLLGVSWLCIPGPEIVRALPPRPTIAPTATPSPTPTALPTLTPLPSPTATPAPTQSPTATPRAKTTPGGWIRLQTTEMTPDLWSVVQWQGADGVWHEVTGWRSHPQLGSQRWWVSSHDFGKGPFRWLLYAEESGPQLVASSPFFLPTAAYQVVEISIYFPESPR